MVLVSVSINCNFESGDQCQFVQDTTDQYDWTFGFPSGVTPHSGSKCNTLGWGGVARGGVYEG